MNSWSFVYGLIIGFAISWGGFEIATARLDEKRRRALELANGDALGQARQTTRTSVMSHVSTQAALDAAVAAGDLDIVVESSGGVWLYLSGSATVRAYGSATVQAYGSATVRAYDSATVQASGSATVQAYDSATVQAYDSATVQAYDSATVQASKYTAVHLHSKRVRLDAKGAVIDITDIDRHDPAAWCDYNGVDIKRGAVTVYKAVTADLKSGMGFIYPIGTTVTDPQWAPTDACGAGLHFGPTPGHALAYHDTATRFLACRVKITEMVGITGHPADTAKCKAKACKVLYEVDIHGNRIDGPVPS